MKKLLFLFLLLLPIRSYALLNVYYSVSPFGTGNLLDGGGSPTITITSGSTVLTLAGEAYTHDNIGQGVAVQYDDGSAKTAFISSITSTTVFDLVTAIGGAPANATDATVSSINYEYASIAAAEAGFTDSDHVDDTDLTNADVVVNLDCYYDPDDNTHDTGATTVDYGTQDATRYMQIIAPNGGSTSINNQRSETGQYDANKYVFSPASGSSALVYEESNARIEGLQFLWNNDTGTQYLTIDFQPGSSSGTCDFRVTDCIFNGNGKRGTGIYLSSIQAGTAKSINNIIYGYSTGSSSAGIFGLDSGWSEILVLNNTISANSDGVGQSVGTVTIKNSAIFNNDDDFVGASTCDYCASDDADATSYTNGIDWDAGATDWDANFTDYSSDDYSVLDVGADIYNAGTNTGAPSYDIIEISRPQATTVDIGAYEFVVAASSRRVIFVE